MADASVWTTLIPVLGTLGGATLGSVVTSVSTSRRERFDRRDTYRAEQREAIVTVLHAGDEWLDYANALISSIEQTPNRDDWRAAPEFTYYEKRTAELARHLTDARVKMDYSPIFSDMRDVRHKTKDFLPLAWSLHYAYRTRTVEWPLEALKEYDKCVAALDSIEHLLSRIEGYTVIYLQPGQPHWWRRTRVVSTSIRTVRFKGNENNTEFEGLSD